SMLITNAAGDLEWATIEDIVQGNETVTTLVDNLDGTITYTNEEGNSITIDLAEGPAGADGESAYEEWLNAGNIGSEQDFLDSLKGEDGADGADGADGQDGATPEIIDGNWWIDGQDT